MTSEEKKQITQLRKRGCTYQEISQETGLALSAVKMHFQRMKPAANTEKCQCCKKPLGKDAPKKKKFCSDACRTKWWRTHPEQLSQSQEHKYTCPVCGKDFYAYRHTKYCSRGCYYQSQRKAGEANA